MSTTTDRERWQAIADFARRNHGLVTREASGLTKGRWFGAIAAGRLEPRHPGVAAMPGLPLTPEHPIAAAVLAVGPTALASHRAAALLHGLLPPEARSDDGAVDVLTVDRNRRPRLTGVRLHRPTDLGRLRPQRPCGIRATNVLRTLLDLGAVAPHLVSHAVGIALTNHLVDLDAVEATLIRHARRGRSGVSALRTAVDEWSIDRKPADSTLEIAMTRLVERHGLPPVEFHPTVGRFEPDFRVIGTCVLLECDGWAFHGRHRDRFERDRERDAELIAGGWVIVRFTYRAITRTPAATAARIRSAINRWARAPVPDAA